MSGADGRAARRAVPRGAHAGWHPPNGRRDPVDILEEQAASRLPELIPIRYGRMLASEFAFLRGSAAIMAADLAGTPTSGLRVQLCGDAHLTNFGGYNSPERVLVFDINDFDETLPGPFEWDVKRLAASLAVAGGERGLSGTRRRELVTRAVRQYREAMAGFARLGALDVWYARLDATGILARWHAAQRASTRLRRTLDRAGARTSLGAFQKLTRSVDGVPRIVSRPPLLVPIEELVPGEAAVEVFRDILERYRRSLADDRRHLLERFRYAHLARKVVGVGSVGTRAWIMLLLDRDRDVPLMLQFKEAQPAVLAPYAGASRYAHQGRRVVEGQRRMQAASDIFLGWVRAPGVDGVARDFYVRQLWDGKISADVERMPASLLGLYGRMCGWTLARAHARSGDRTAIAAYLGSGPRFDAAVADFAEAYARQTAEDRQSLAAAVRAGRVAARPGV